MFSMNERLLRKCQPSLEFVVKSRAAGVWTLETDEVDVSFNIYLNWLCKGKMYIDYLSDRTKDHKKTWVNIACVYALSQDLEDSSFADAITDAVTTMFEQDRSDDHVCLPTAGSTLKRIYAIIEPDSSLCELLVHRFAALDNIHDMILPTWPKKFMHSLVERLSRRFNIASEGLRTKEAALACHFHDHVTAEECYRLKVV